MSDSKTKILNFREFEIDDSDTLWHLIDQDLNAVPTSWPKHKEHFLDWLASSIENELPSKFVVEYEKEIAGVVSVDYISEDNILNFQMSKIGDANVSYMTLPTFAGKGVASFALNEISNILEEKNIDPLLRIAIWNKASAKVAEKCGFIKCDADVVVQDFFDEEPTILNVYRKLKN